MVQREWEHLLTRGAAAREAVQEPEPAPARAGVVRAALASRVWRVGERAEAEVVEGDGLSRMLGGHRVRAMLSGGTYSGDDEPLDGPVRAGFFPQE